jgi:hypothetical protein
MLIRNAFQYLTGMRLLGFGLILLSRLRGQAREPQVGNSQIIFCAFFRFFPNLAKSSEELFRLFVIA